MTGGHYGRNQSVAKVTELRHETEDLEKQLAEIYARIEGGEDTADLTAPRGACPDASVARRGVPRGDPNRLSPSLSSVRQLLTSGAVKRPALLTCYQPPLLGAPEGAEGMDLGRLAEAAFASAEGTLAVRPAGGALALSYNRALGMDPAARPVKLSEEQLAEASGKMVATTLRDLTLPD